MKADEYAGLAGVEGRKGTLSRDTHRPYKTASTRCARDILTRLAAVALCLFAPSAMAQENRATFPADFDQMVMYGDYRRGSGGELAYALPETIAIAQSGQTLPPGTHLVLEIYNDDALVSYFVMEKGEGWGLDFAEEDRAGDWHFQQFGTDRTVQREAIADRCVSCHQGAAENDFMFTLGRMQDYMP